MTRKQSKAMLAEIAQKLGIDIKVFNWLSVLPLYDEKGKPITVDPLPIVYYPTNSRAALEAELSQIGRKLTWSTFFYVEGYHHPKGTSTAAVGFLKS